MLITVANSFDQSQARENGGPDVDQICLALIVHNFEFPKEILEKVDFKKNQ